MTKIDIFSGFLGSGKTTLIKKLIEESYSGEKLVLIENEFGEIGIDGGFLKDAGVEITEMNSGCICCSLVGDFGEALKKVLSDFTPDRIVIEPSGVGKLSDVIKAVRNINSDEIQLNGFTTVVDAGKCKMYMKNFGEFFNDQIEHAGTIIMSHADVVSAEKLETAVKLVKEKNPDAVVVTTPISQLDGKQLLQAIERKDSLETALHHLMHEHEEECDDENCSCHHNHHEHCDHGHEHHHEHEHHHGHEHHHEHGEECSCGCHHEHGHHHADEVFVSWGKETTKSFTKEALEAILEEICDETKYGMVLRAKGIVEGADGSWIHFDYIPGEADIRNGSAGVTGRLCVIGAKLNEENINALFLS
ncbi:MAG: GTP-binding protein [Clostridia bacterium]|nr:GTP-binding protein [Clostridia bacterium]